MRIQRKLRILFKIFLLTALVTPAAFSQPTIILSEAVNQFAFDLYARLDIQDNNIFFSPYSLSSALSMTYEGANGQTADEMRTVLHFSSNDLSRRTEISRLIQEVNRADKKYEMSTANALWGQKAYPFKEEYFNLVKNIYFGEAHNLDFVADTEGSRKTINNWVSTNTKNRINDLLPPGSITGLTRLVLTNAVYFKGKWSVPFIKEKTKQDAFWLSPAQPIQTAMMELVGKSFRYAENDQAQILELPYQGDDLSMFILLPRGQDIRPMEKTINASFLQAWSAEMQQEPVDVYMPRFKFQSIYQMKQALFEMGIKDAFDAQKADFSGMTGHQGLYIDEVYHKAWIDVNEEGTEAAAATAIVAPFGNVMVREPSEPKIFRANHPFIFIIKDRQTGHILFIGRVSDPREK
jgi:serpin B